MSHKTPITRRTFNASAAGFLATPFLANAAKATETDTSEFSLRYMLGSCMYGRTDLAEILPEVKKIGATAIDIWPAVHGNQREQLDALGEERFAELLRSHGVTLGCITQYKLGPFGLAEEMRLAQRLGCRLIVTGGRGPKGLKGEELKKAVADFLEQMKPHLATAETTGVTIAIENHANNLIESPDSMKWLAELSPSANLGIALAPYHLPQDHRLISELITTLADRIKVFYAWQHGEGCMVKLPKQRELLQMPGRGPLDFGPILGALKKIDYKGVTEIFMHPVPRGIPILEPTSAVTAEINRARRYLAKCLKDVKETAIHF